MPLLLAGRYAIERELGRGGMAVVYLAKDQRHRREVAIKVFRVEGGPLDGAPRFLHEIEVAARLSHPNILPLHDSGETDGLLYYVMPYVPGENLRQRLEREGALPVADALAIAIQVAGALAYAHSHGVIHRDIKPENILFIAGQAVVADFGIARAISAGGWEEFQLGRGLLGTPAYMSPEQAQSGSRVDGRSDLYSLGCVLYEMLTGEPPFRGSTPEELVVQHIEAEPAPVHARRPTLTRDLELTVGKALAKHPADRYQTAQQFSEALAGLTTGRRVLEGEDPVVRPSGPAPAASRFMRWATPGLAALAVGYAVYSQIPDDPAWSWRAGNPSLHLIAPFVHKAGAAPELLSGDQCSRLVQEALSRWSDIDLVDSRWTADQIDRLGHTPTIDDLFSMARRARAGRLISGEVYQFRDSIRVRGVLYDVRRRGQVLRERTITVAGDLGDADRQFTVLADSLLVERAAAPAAAGGAMGTHLLAAWQAYDSGHVALTHWDLPDASRHFATAIALDPGYGLAHLWLAQTENWNGESRDVWRDHAFAGLGATPGLPPRDHEWALALAALAEARYPEACERYDAMVRRDSLDFRGWYGRAECRARDPVVVADAKAPGGLRFRGSWQTAIADYQRALTLIPSSHQAFRGAAFERLTKLLFAQYQSVRWGKSNRPDSLQYAAVPALASDTLVFTPFPMARLGDANVERLYPATWSAAITRNRQVLRRITDGWARDFPTSSAALEGQARSLELLGLFEASGGASSALASYEAAARLTTDTATLIRLGTARTRVLLKLGRLPAVRLLADSLLRLSPPDGEAAENLAGLAALTGRPSLAGALLRRGASGFLPMDNGGRQFELPLRLRETALSLAGFASVGGPADSIGQLLRDGERQLQAYATPASRAELSAVLFSDTRAQLFPDPVSVPPAGTASTGNYLLRLQSAYRKGDTLEVRRTLASMARSRRVVTSGAVAPEFGLQEARLFLQLGDSTAAAARLDTLLAGMPSLGLDLFRQVQQPGALVRAMILRADLAAGARQADVARKWAHDALTLWSGSEPSLAPEIAALERLARMPS